jgi:hypothetical protein
MNLTYNDPTVGAIRPSVIEDCYVIGSNMSKQDALEVWSYDRSIPTEAVLKSFNKSVICMTILHEIPIAMFGIMPINMSSGILWILTTDGLRDGKFGRPFVRNCKKWFNDMLDIYPRLYGMVDLRNKESIRWLTYLDAEWGEDSLEGIDKLPFKMFKFIKE